MNNIFDIKRFGRYFALDFRKANNNYGLSALILGLFPVFLFVIMWLFGGVINDSGISEYGHGAIVGLPFALIVLIFTFPTKVYGSLTDKRHGSDWLMVPASGFEKWLSMIIISCVILPLVFSVLYFGSDWLLGTMFKSYGTPIIDMAGFGVYSVDGYTDPYGNSVPAVSFNFLGIAWASWCVCILIFLLGAVVFKKGKAAKTLLVYFLASTILSSIFFACIGRTNIDSSYIAELLGSTTLERVTTKVNTFLSLSFGLTLAALGGALFWRIKTIKH